MWRRSPLTPNELIERNKEYRDYVRGFALWNEYKKPYKFMQVRIVKQKPSVVYGPTTNWWDDPDFMDHIYWVFLKPISDRIDNAFFSYYALEPVESAQIYAELESRGGKLGKRMNGFVVPCECCVQCYDETKGGIGEHIHYRPERVVSQQAIDARKELDTAALKILNESWDISDRGATQERTAQWESTSNRVRANIKNRLARPS